MPPNRRAADFLRPPFVTSILPDPSRPSRFNSVRAERIASFVAPFGFGVSAALIRDSSWLPRGCDHGRSLNVRSARGLPSIRRDTAVGCGTELTILRSRAAAA